MKKYFINTDYCIGADGAVYSVCIFSDDEISNCHTLLLDPNSRTSNALAQIIVKQYFKFNLEIKHAHDGYENDLKNGTAGVVIGDRAFALHSQYKHACDLGEAWKKFTSLPFVFAAWISNEKLNPAFMHEFNMALRNGVTQKDSLAISKQTDYPEVDIKKYFEEQISFELTPQKREAIDLYLSLTNNL
jgi:chorismate dehydratase